MILTFTNSIHHTKARVRLRRGDRITSSQRLAIRHRLCPFRNCHCGDSLGRHGPQPLNPLALTLIYSTDSPATWLAIPAQHNLDPQSIPADPDPESEGTRYERMLGNLKPQLGD